MQFIFFKDIYLIHFVNYDILRFKDKDYILGTYFLIMQMVQCEILSYPAFFEYIELQLEFFKHIGSFQTKI